MSDLAFGSLIVGVLGGVVVFVALGRVLHAAHLRVLARQHAQTLLRHKALAAQLEDGAVDSGTRILSGRVGAFAVALHPERPRHDNTPLPPFVSTELPELPERELWLEIRPTPTFLGIALSSALDVSLADPTFDRAFVIEGAPTDVVRALLSPALRSDLLALGSDISLRLERTGPLRLERKRWLSEPGEVGEACRLIAAIAAAVPGAFAQADRAVASARPAEGSPYRMSPTQTALVAQRELRRRELDALDGLHERRRKRKARLLMLAVASAAGFALSRLVMALGG